MDKPIVRAAVVQAASVLFDTPETIAKLENLVREAATKADIAVFPEAFVGGYPKGLDFGARLGCEAPKAVMRTAVISKARSRCRAPNARKSARWREIPVCISSSGS